MKAERITRSAALPLLLLIAGAAWIVVVGMPSFTAFNVGQYLSLSSAAAYAWATTIVGFLNSWAGFAMAVAFAAAVGMSWSVVLIKAVLQKVGLKFAIQYATML